MTGRRGWRRLADVAAAAFDDSLRGATAKLRTAGVDNPAREARLLAELVVGCDDPRTLSPRENRHLAALIARRARREPFARIAGVREFWSLDFEVTVDTLIPRPDSETLIECCLDRFERRPPARILDLGTGSGCLVVTLLVTWTGSSGIGVDVSERACAVAARNARRHGVGDRAWIMCGDWAAALDTPAIGALVRAWPRFCRETAWPSLNMAPTSGTDSQVSLATTVLTWPGQSTTTAVGTVSSFWRIENREESPWKAPPDWLPSDDGKGIPVSGNVRYLRQRNRLVTPRNTECTHPAGPSLPTEQKPSRASFP